MTAVTSDGILYEVKKGNTFLDRLDITKIEGMVTGTIYTNMLGGDTAKDGRVYIDGERYKTADAEIQNYAGATVCAYYKAVKGE